MMRTVFRITAILALALFIGEIMMSPANAQTPRSAPSGLPHEPDSSSDILKATHIFTIVIGSVNAEPWSIGKDGLEHRVLVINTNLADLYKGSFSIMRGEQFRFQVRQSREPGGVVSDYHGLWSHLNPQTGNRYLVIAGGDQMNPAALVVEPLCQSILDADRAFDVSLAIEIENRLRVNPPKPDDEEAQIVRFTNLLEFVMKEGSAAQRLFAQYLWVRVQPFVEAFPKRAWPRIIRFMETGGMNLRFRQEFIDRVYREVLDLDAPMELRRLLLSCVFNILLQPGSKPLQSSLIDVYAYNLIFRPGEAAAPVQSRLLDPRVSVDEVAKVAAKSGSDRGRKIADWLGRH